MKQIQKASNSMFRLFINCTLVRKTSIHQSKFLIILIPYYLLTDIVLVLLIRIDIIVVLIRYVFIQIAVLK